MAEEIIDLSYDLNTETPPFPGDPPLTISILRSTSPDPLTDGDSSNTSRISVCLHCGTHLDAPFHFDGNGRTIDQVPLEQCMGECLLLDMTDLSPNEEILVARLAPHEADLRSTRKVVINSGWSRHWDMPVFFEDHPVFCKAAADFLVKCGIELVGLDFPSLDRAPFEAHVSLLGSGAVVLENLKNLALIDVTRFQLVATPLKISGRDGSPVRAIAIVGR